MVYVCAFVGMYYIYSLYFVHCGENKYRNTQGEKERVGSLFSFCWGGKRQIHNLLYAQEEEGTRILCVLPVDVRVGVVEMEVDAEADVEAVAAGWQLSSHRRGRVM